MHKLRVATLVIYVFSCLDCVTKWMIVLYIFAVDLQCCFFSVCATSQIKRVVKRTDIMVIILTIRGWWWWWLLLLVLRCGIIWCWWMEMRVARHVLVLLGGCQNLWRGWILNYKSADLMWPSVTMTCVKRVWRLGDLGNYVLEMWIL